MKVKQVVGEHKKGFRAKKYASKPKAYIEPHKPKAPEKMDEEMPGQMVGKVQQVKPDGTVDIQKPSGDTTTVQATALQPGDNNKLTIQTPKIQPGMQVDAEKTIEEQPDDAGLVKHYAAQLQALLPKATQPWEQAQIQARIKAATKDGWIPRNPDGSPIAVLPPKEWEAKTDPQTVLKINGVNGPGLSPEFKQKMGGAVSQGIMKYTGFEESADNKLLDKMLTIAGLR